MVDIPARKNIESKFALLRDRPGQRQFPHHDEIVQLVAVLGASFSTVLFDLTFEQSKCSSEICPDPLFIEILGPLFVP